MMGNGCMFEYDRHHFDIRDFLHNKAIPATATIAPATDPAVAMGCAAAVKNVA